MAMRFDLAALIVIAVLIFAAGTARAEWVDGHGDYSFGPDMTQSAACQKAERRAREEALKKLTSETVSSEDLMICSEKGNEAACDLNRMTWSTIDGEIKGVRNRVVKTEDSVSGYRKCIVDLQADVGTAKGRSDPGFDMAVKLNEKAFKEGDLLRIRIEPSQPMYISVFQWLPYEKGENQVMLIFPNAYEKENHFKRAGFIPTEEGVRNYDFALGFPEGQPESIRLVDEWLMVVGTKKQVTFRDTYRLDEFRGRLLEISRENIRLVRRGYSVVKSK